MGKITRTNFGCTVTARLTNAQIVSVTGAASTYELVAAPGAGKSFVFISAVIRFICVASYTNIDANDAALAISAGSIISTGLYNSATPQSDFSTFFAPGPNDITVFLGTPFNTQNRPDPWGTGAGPYGTSNIENQALALQIYNGAGAFTGGDSGNHLTCTVFYAIADIM